MPFCFLIRHGRFYFTNQQCPKSRKIEDKIPSYYYPQVQMQLECCDLEVCDFVQYNPQGHNKQDEQLVITEVKRDRQGWGTHMPLIRAIHEQDMAYKQAPPQVYEV